MLKRINSLLIICMILPLLSGCWDQLPIEDRANVLGIAIDQVDPESVREQADVTYHPEDDPAPQEAGIRLTAQIAVPGRLPLGATDNGSSEKSPVWVLSVVAKTLDAAIADLQQEVADELFFGHLRVVIVSQQVAESGLDELGDYMRRNPKIRRTVWMAVSEGNAAALMKVAPPLERVPTLYLTAMLVNSAEMGKFPYMPQGKFWSFYSAKGQEPFLPYLSVEEKENIKVKGLAYFRNDRMVGVTDALQIGYFMGVMGMDPGGYSILMPFPGSHESAYYMFRATDRQAKRDLTLQHGKPKLTVDVLIEGDVEEVVGKSLTHGVIREMEQQIEDEQTNYLKLIKQTQEKRSDIFGFGETVRGNLPHYWDERVRTSRRWQEMYEHLPVEVKLRVKIRHIGTKGSL